MTSAAQTGMESTGSRYRGSIIASLCSTSNANVPSAKVGCCPHTPTRKIRRSIHEPARDVARAIAKSRLYKQSRKDRKKVEMLFAHLKRILRLDRLRLRG